MALNIWDILRKHYPANEYALMKEVSDAAGFNRSRSADYIAVNLWPSRGLTIDGIELKSFRGDWLNELKNPKKAENIFKYCDFFYLLTTDDTIAKEEEIPASWGWKYIKGEKVIIKKKAPRLSPQPISRDFMVAMLKRASDRSEFVHISAIEERIKQANQEGKDYNKIALERLQREYKDLNESVREFENGSGISIKASRWSMDTGKELGEAVRFIRDGGAESIREQLLKLETTAQHILNQINSGLKILHIENKCNYQHVNWGDVISGDNYNKLSKELKMSYRPSDNKEVTHYQCDDGIIKPLFNRPEPKI